MHTLERFFSRKILLAGMLFWAGMICLISPVQAQVMTGNGYSVVPHILPINDTSSGNGYYNHASGQALNGAVQGTGYQINSIYPVPTPAHNTGGVSGDQFTGGTVVSPSPTASSTPRVTPVASPRASGLPTEEPAITPTPGNEQTPVPTDHQSAPGRSGPTAQNGDTNQANELNVPTNPTLPGSGGNGGVVTSPSPSPTANPLHPTSSPEGTKNTGSGETPLHGSAPSITGCSPVWFFLLLIVSFLNFLVLFVRKSKIVRFGLYACVASIISFLALWETWVCTWYYVFPVVIGLLTLWQTKKEKDSRMEHEEVQSTPVETVGDPGQPAPVDNQDSSTESSKGILS